MYRSNTCGELRLSDAGKEVTLAGWVQASAMSGCTLQHLKNGWSNKTGRIKA
jgi:aspartyl-tRNA synthetase